MTQVNLPKIRKYHVWIPGKRCIATDSPDYAEKKAILANGTVYEDTRYNGRKRLQRLYFRAASLNRLPNEIDYPHLITLIN